MPTELQNLATNNFVSVTGKVVDLDLELKTTRTGKQAMKVSGQISVDGRARVPFNNFIMKEKKAGGVRKDYQAFAALHGAVKTIKNVGEDEATVLQLTGRFAVRDFMTRQDMLITNTGFSPSNVRTMSSITPGEAWADWTGYIKDIVEQENSLKVQTLGLDFKGDIIPFDFMVLGDYKDQFFNVFAPDQTIQCSVGYKVLESTAPEQASGGIGIMRTRGSDRFGWVFEGAKDPLYPGDVGAIDPELIQAGMAKRAAMLRALQEEGYKGGAAIRGKGTPESPIYPSGMGVPRNDGMSLAPAIDMSDDEWDF